MEKDRVCGKKVSKRKAEVKYEFQGFTYYFCSSACRDKFAEATLAGMNS